MHHVEDRVDAKPEVLPGLLACLRVEDQVDGLVGGQNITSCASLFAAISQ